MKAVRLLMASFAVVALVAVVQAQDKPDLAKQLVGKWEATKVDEGVKLAKGAIVEFAADGKLKVTHKDGDTEKKSEGTYTIVPHGFTYVIKGADRDVKGKIIVKKISDTEMLTENDEGKAATLKRVK
jgi:uncharacterized protein (TIGR03066 family)